MNEAVADIHHYKLLILDFGSQYTQLIARRAREIGVYCEIHPCDMPDQQILEFGAAGIILSGGPESTIDECALPIPAAVFEASVPVLGICYGMQAMALHFGGEVVNSGHSEFGYAKIQVTADSELLNHLSDRADGTPELDVWMSHGDHVAKLPAGFECVASSGNAPIAVMADKNRNYYGIQFHPEVTHTTSGKEILQRFISQLCRCECEWTSDNIIDDAITRIRQQVGDEEVILALSGGVDSSVVALLLHRAIGDQLNCVFVDNGLLRLHEGDQVMKMFAENLGVKVIRVDAEKRFLQALDGEADPEAKRKIIGNVFIDVFEEEAGKLTSARWLAQGTIYPDVIESAGASTGKAHLIKSHHNVGGLPEDMSLKLIEPLRELFKDEVRRLGLELGLPAKMINRHPFPGPGLGVRILGPVCREYADILRRADAIFIDALYQHGLYEQVSQAFTVFLPVKSVGVTGDGRRYGYVLSLRAVETIDFMTARAAHLPYDFLDEVCRSILNEVSEVARVSYDISSKPPATIEWE